MNKHSSSSISSTIINDYSTTINIDNIPNYQTIHIDNDIYTLFSFSLLTQIHHKNKFIKYLTPFLTNIILITSFSSIFFYKDYYVNHPEAWTIHLFTLIICFNYIYYLMTNWNTNKLFHNINPPNKYRYISLICSTIFMFYFIYYSIIVLYTHKNKSPLYQFFNITFLIGWYIFFSVCSSTYYFITIKLHQKATVLYQWIISLKNTQPPIQDFYTQYNIHYKNIKFFSKQWNFIILVGFITLTFNLPLDYISIFYNHLYYVIPGAIIKTNLLIYYIYSICSYNLYQKYIISYLYKHRLYDFNTIKDIEIYIQHRPISLNFYGFVIDGNLITKIIIILFNLIIPIIYGILQNFFI